MKKIIVLLLVLSVNVLCAQSRVNKVMDSFVSESEKLTSFIGWDQNTGTGKWIDNKNVIHHKICPDYWVSRIEQNLDWLQVKTLIKNKVKYYVFLYERQSGNYRYPNIRKDWENQKNTHFFVLTATEYNSFKSSIELKDGVSFIVTSKIQGYVTDRFHSLGGSSLYNEANLLAKINNEIDSPSYWSYNMVFNSQLTDGLEVVRFRLPSKSDMEKDYIKTSYFENRYDAFKVLLID